MNGPVDDPIRPDDRMIGSGWMIGSDRMAGPDDRVG
jgi:hypothetical protein